MSIYKFTLISIFLFLSANAIAQNIYFTKTGHIYFISHTFIIDIDAVNNNTGSFLNIKTGEIILVVIMKSFEFKLALAEEHFNENYVESHKYPKSKFKGKIINIHNIDLAKQGRYDVVVEGELTIHGITNKIKKKGTLVVKNGKIYAKSKFEISLKDYNIKIPNLVKNKVAEIIPIDVNMVYELYNK